MIKPERCSWSAEHCSARPVTWVRCYQSHSQKGSHHLVRTVDCHFHQPKAAPNARSNAPRSEFNGIVPAKAKSQALSQILSLRWIVTSTITSARVIEHQRAKSLCGVAQSQLLALSHRSFHRFVRTTNADGRRRLGTLRANSFFTIIRSRWVDAISSDGSDDASCRAHCRHAKSQTCHHRHANRFGVRVARSGVDFIFSRHRRMGLCLLVCLWPGENVSLVGERVVHAAIGDA